MGKTARKAIFSKRARKTSKKYPVLKEFILEKIHTSKT
jgi:hypothetical protein